MTPAQNDALTPDVAPHDAADTEAAEPRSRWRVPKAALLYSAIVFGVGFIFGPIRELWAVPRFGPRVAELMEMPLMLVAMILAARTVAHRLAVPPTLWARLGMGLGALAGLLAAEFGFVLQLRGLSIAEYIATRDPVSGAVYYGMLCVFAIMPWLLVRHQRTP
jgi:hypothetical protein